MKLWKISILTLLLIIVTCHNVTGVNASVIQKAAVYDMKKGGIQKFEIAGENGTVHEVIIEEIQENRIGDGTYKVTYKNTGFWDAGFYITVSTNQIINAYSPFYFTYTGEIKAPILTKNSSIKATYAFIYQKTLLNFNTGVVATISNSNLVVTKK